MQTPFFTLAEAAAYARVSKRTIQRYLKEGTLKRYGFGRKPLIHGEELKNLLAPTPALAGISEPDEECVPDANGNEKGAFRKGQRHPLSPYGASASPKARDSP